MTKKKPRIKADAVAHWVPSDRNEASDAIAEIGRLTRELSRIEAKMNDQLALTKARHDANAKPLIERRAELAKGVKLYCEAQRAALTDNFKVKFHRFAAGEVSWRLTPFAVAIRNAGDVLATLKERQLNKYLRIKEEIDRDALLANRKEVAALQIDGIAFRQKEEFAIEPNEAKLDEVAPGPGPGVSA